jgi:hypothetical protein
LDQHAKAYGKQSKVLEHVFRWEAEAREPRPETGTSNLDAAVRVSGKQPPSPPYCAIYSRSAFQLKEHEAFGYAKECAESQS